MKKKRYLELDKHNYGHWHKTFFTKSPIDSLLPPFITPTKRVVRGVWPKSMLVEELEVSHIFGKK